MKELFVTELRRFRNTALIAAAVHLIVLVLINQLYPLLQLFVEPYVAMLGLYMLAGAGLGLYQFGSYRQPNRWIWLMQRPVSHRSIFLALAAAVGVLVLFAIGLPALVVVAGNDLFGQNVVDLRHYLLVPYLMLFSAMGWMCGAYIMLGRSRTAFVLAVLPFWMLLHPASGLALMLPALACLALLGFVVHKAVKPNRTAPPKTAGALLTVSLPLQLGFYFAVLWAGSLGFQYGQMLLGVHPLNRDIDPPDGYTEATRAETPKLMALGLAASTDARAEHWKRQVALSEGTSNSPFKPLRYEVRQGLSNVQNNSFTVDGVRWTFSHDSMRFEGTRLRTRKPAGSLGIDGSKPFPAVPIRIGMSADFSYLQLPHALLGLETKGGMRTWTLAQFGKDEYLASIPRTYDKRTYMLTNQRLLAFHERTSDSAMLEPIFAVQLPRQVSDLATSDMVHLLDGTLVSFTYGKRMFDGVPDPVQVVYMVNHQGAAQEVARRQLAHDFPILFEHKDWWISPAMHAIASLPQRFYDVGTIPDGERFPAPAFMPRPAIAWVAALGGMLISGAAAWWWLRRTPTARRLRITWIASCLLLGVPALLSLIVLQARTRPLAASRPIAGAPSPA